MSQESRVYAEVRHFVAFSAGQGVSSVGGWMQKTAVGWLAWDLTHSAVWVGCMASADIFAALVVAPFAGAVADRGNAYRLMWLLQTLLLIQAASLFFLQTSGYLSIGLLLAMTVLESTLQGFNQPVRMIVTGTLAGPARMSQAVASNSIAVSIARSTGPAVAGGIMLSGHTEYVFLANALSFLAMLLAVLYVRRWIDNPTYTGKAPLFGEIADGFRYASHTPEISSVFVLAIAFAVLARPFSELFPAFAGAVFKGGPQTLAWFMTAQGLGAMLGAAWMLKRSSSESLPAVAQGFGIVLGLSLVIFTASPNLYVALPALVLAGLCHVVCNIAMQSLAQLRAAPEMRGRVLALYGLMFRTGPCVGAFLIGQATRWAKLQWLVGGGAMIYGLFMLWLFVSQRRARNPSFTTSQAVPIPLQKERAVS